MLVLAGKALVKPIKEKSSSLLTLVDNKPATKGVIVNIGKMLPDATSDIKNGDIVFFGGASGIEVDENGEKYMMYKISDFIAVIDEDVSIKTK